MLTDAKIRAIKPNGKAEKLFDGGGLYLFVSATGVLSWRYKFKYDGKEQQLTIGQYPLISLKEARAAHAEAKKALMAGENPCQRKKNKKIEAARAAANSFEAVAAEFIESLKESGKADVTVEKNRWYISHLAPILKQPVDEIRARDILPILKDIQKSGKRETAKRVRAFAARVFRYAMMTDRAQFNVAADLGMALAPPIVKHYSAVLEPDKVGRLMRAIDDYSGSNLTRLALKLAAHVFPRPGMIRKAEWDEIDLENAVWKIPSSKMKMRRDHEVPLSRQAIEIFEEAKETKHLGKYVFPSVQTWLKPMSENTLNNALRRMGYSKDQMTSHGFRSLATTLLNESGLWSVDAIEVALAHKDANNVRAAYNRGKYWDERVRMAQWCSDYLDALQCNGAVRPAVADLSPA